MSYKMNVLKALGIISMVMTHAGESLVKYLPGWRMPMFVFLSGYFFNEKYLDNVWQYACKKFKNLIVPMYGWHLFYGIVVTILLSCGYVRFGTPLSLKSYFITSVHHGHQYVFSLALWFVAILFLVQISYAMIRKIYKNHIKSEIPMLIALITLNLGAVHIAKQGFHIKFTPPLMLPIEKIMFLLVFFYIGWLYKNKLEKHDEFKAWKLALPFLVNLFLSAFCTKGTGHIGYTISWMQFGKGYDFVPLLVSLSGIYFWMHIADLIARTVPRNDFIYTLGESTFPIMVHHLFCFWLLNTFFLMLKEQGVFQMLFFNHERYMTDIYYRVPRYQPLMDFAYVIVGITGSLLIDWGYQTLKKKLISK
ncbi:MAG: acyltransferase family protein [Pyramidobacter sp.]|nr:acyltransferase family protein [Pyramidobacter sp.]